LELEAHVQAVEKAARDWGVSADQLEGKFVAALLGAISAVGRSNIATIGDLGKILEGTREAGEAELRRLRLLLDGGHQVLELAHEATKIAARAEEQTQFEYDQSIQRVARTMATALLSETSGWLILKQTNYNRGMAMRFAAIAGATMLFIAWSGYQVRAWEDGPTMDAAGRCAATSFTVRIGDNAAPQRACLAESFEPRELKDFPSAVKGWFRSWGS
jgi:hypothetical protein